VNRIALRTIVASLALASMFAPAKLSAQDSANAPETKAPGTQQNAPESKAPAAPQPTAPLAHPDNDYWRKHDAQLLVDFPGWHDSRRLI